MGDGAVAPPNEAPPVLIPVNERGSHPSAGTGTAPVSVCPRLGTKAAEVEHLPSVLTTGCYYTLINHTTLSQ